MALPLDKEALRAANRMTENSEALSYGDVDDAERNRGASSPLQHLVDNDCTSEYIHHHRWRETLKDCISGGYT